MMSMHDDHKREDVTPMRLKLQATIRALPNLNLEVAEAGELDHPLVILLHGFPDSWQTWHRQMAALVSNGFRVLAPNQRGYGRSDKPAGIAAYDIDVLADDIVALATSAGARHFHLIGHDWGGTVAFRVASLFPDRVKTLVVMNAPHPGIFKSYVLSHPAQMLRSWYVGLFQIPALPEWLLSVQNYALLFRAIEKTSVPGTFDESDRQRLVHDWAEAGALHAMLNYYRAIVRRTEASLRSRVITPTRLFFGRNDPAEQPGLAVASLKLCESDEIIWFDQCRHWPHREDCNRTNTILIDFLKNAAPKADEVARA